jgi:23S rRNA (cytosine1962-C5)-methyltransferase
MMILEVEHLHDIRADRASVVRDRRARVIEQGANYAREGERVVGVEDGLKFWCEPWEGIDVGFFADQRENRRKMRRIANSGERWLNLFCHTGAFTVALAAMGCRVVSVDLSRRYLDWLEENLELNHLSQGLNQSVADDARAYLSGDGKRPGEKFDGIIVDPPTAAAGSAGFWSVKKDYEDLLVACFKRLAEGGAMLACRNEKRPAQTLEKLVRRAAKRAGRKLSNVESAPPAFDYPQMKGFPEGDSFEGVWIRASG